MPRSADFEKIYRQFMRRYCGSAQTECDKGKGAYYGWLNKMGLDDTKPYEGLKEAFSWLQSSFGFLRADQNARYYKVEAAFPLSSMNNYVYSEKELTQATRSLVGKPVTVNHVGKPLDGVSIEDAEYENGAAEVLMRVEKSAKWLGTPITRLIDDGEFLHVSVEADCKRGFQIDPEGLLCQGMVYTGLALLTKDVLPGVPLTRIMPVEKLVESITLEDEIMEQKIEEIEWTTAYINDLPDSAFAVIAPDGEKDEDGKTVPRTLRHLPHHDAQGNLDLPHLRAALARMNQIEPANLQPEAKRHLCAHAKASDIVSEFCGEEETKCNKKMENARVKAQQTLETRELIYQIEHLRADLKAEQARSEELSSKLTQCQGHNQSLELEFAQEHETVLARDKKVAELTAQNAQFQVQLENLKQNFTDTQDKLGESQIFGEELNKKYSQILASNVTLTKELAQLKEENVNLMRQNEDYKEKLKKAKRVGRIIVKI